MTNVYLVDDHPLILNTLASILEESMCCSIVGQSSNFDESTIDELIHLNAELVILDVSMPTIDSFDLVPLLKKRVPYIKIIIYTMHSLNRYYQHFMKLGVDGYLIKSNGFGNLVEAIEEVNIGNKYFPNSILDSILKSDEKMEENQLQFTKFEKDVLSELSVSKNNKTIADNLNCTVQKVLNTRQNLLIKTGTNNIDELLKTF
ncbi:MAG: response regulator transcription factor [Schleiferiaceae bacterium]|nr:response regulator transcription factor [Schleiferiaceae bacterium]